MAPIFDMDAPSPTVENVVGCRQDPRAARLMRARRRGDEMGPGSGANRAMSEAAAAICWQPSEPAGPAQQARANLRAESPGQRQRAREAAVAAREDSLARFMAENEAKDNRSGTPTAGPMVGNSPKRPPAGRCASVPARNRGNPYPGQDAVQPSGIGGPIGGAIEQLPPPPRRNNDGGIFGGMQDGNLPAPPPRRSVGGPFALDDGGQVPPVSKRAYGGGAPFAMDEGRPPLAPARKGVPYGLPGPAMPSPFGGMQEGGRPLVSGVGMQMKGLGSQGHSISANAYACGANQNCGNVLTEKPTSRVLKPPGGGGSLRIGGW